MAIRDTEDDFSNFFQPGGPTKSFNVNYSKDPITIEGQVMGRPGRKGSSSSQVRKKVSTRNTPRLANSPGASRSPGLGDITPVTAESAAIDNQTAAINQQTGVMQDQADFSKGLNLATAAAGFLVDVFNANNAYRAINLAGKLQIQESRRLAHLAIERGIKRGAEARGEGLLAGEQSLLSLAAQGQDVTSTGVEEVRSSFEDVGLMNAVQEEISGITEALGYNLEEVAINYQIDNAAIDREAAIGSSALNLAASAAFSF